MNSDVLDICCLEIEFTLKPGKRREFSRSSEDLLRHEGEGHVRTTVYEDREEPGHMIWIAEWASRRAVEEYMHGQGFAVLLGALRVLSTQASCRLVDQTGPARTAVEGLSSRPLKEAVATPIPFEESEA